MDFWMTRTKLALRGKGFALVYPHARATLTGVAPRVYNPAFSSCSHLYSRGCLAVQGVLTSFKWIIIRFYPYLRVI